MVLVAVALEMHGSATKLQNKRNIGITGAVTGTATAFDGSANINIPTTAVNPDYLSKVVPTSKGGTGNTSGNAATATKLLNKRTIALTGAVTGTATGFDGSGNISIPTTAVNPDNLSKTVPISKGGTGVTSIQKQTVTGNYNGCSASVVCRRFSKVITLDMNISYPASYNGILKNIFTLPSFAKPSEIKNIFITSGNGVFLGLVVNTEGVASSGQIFADGKSAGNIRQTITYIVD